MGLVAIFISVNSQHSVQKCKELLVDLASMVFIEQSYGENAKKQIEKIFASYAIYSKKGFTSKLSVVFAIITLIIISAIWANIIYYSPNLYSYIWVGLSIMVLFLLIISFLFLFSIRQLGGLPKKNLLLDADKKTEVNTIGLAAMTIQLKIYREPGSGLTKIMIGAWPFDFKNIKISPVISGHTFTSSGSAKNTLESIQSENIEVTQALDNSGLGIFFIVAKEVNIDNFDEIDFVFELIGKFSTYRTKFLTLHINKNSLDDIQYNEFPKSIWEIQQNNHS